jgi:hypothetical protein
MSKSRSEINADFNITNALALFARAAKLRPAAFWTLTVWTVGLNVTLLALGAQFGSFAATATELALFLVTLAALLVEIAIFFAWTRFMLTGALPDGLPFRLGKMERAGVLAGVIVTLVTFVPIVTLGVASVFAFSLSIAWISGLLMIVGVVVFFALIYVSLRLAAAVSLSMLLQRSAVRPTWQRGDALVLPVFLSSILVWLFSVACYWLPVLVLRVTGLAEGAPAYPVSLLTLADPMLAGTGVFVVVIVFLVGFPAQLMGMSIPAYAAMAMAGERGPWWDELKADEAEDEARREAEEADA